MKCTEIKYVRIVENVKNVKEQSHTIFVESVGKYSDPD